MQLNLNLLTMLNALLDEKSVMGAADRLHLSQPAVSRALGRIRTITGDPILLRSGRIMTPTPYALTIQKEVHQLVQSAAKILAPQGALELATLDRTFTIRSHELFIGTLGGRLLTVVEKAAPAVRLRFVAESLADTNELKQARVDLELGGTVPTGPDIRHHVLGTGTVAVALRRDHPLADEPLTDETYSAADHVVVSRRGRLHDQIDDALALRGLSRKVVAVVPSTVDALQITQCTDAITAIPIEASRTLIDDLGLIVRQLPLSLPPALAVLSWNRRSESDPAHLWLRDQVEQTFATAYTSSKNEPVPSE